MINFLRMPFFNRRKALQKKAQKIELTPEEVIVLGMFNPISRGVSFGNGGQRAIATLKAKGMLTPSDDPTITDLGRQALVFQITGPQP